MSPVLFMAIESSWMTHRWAFHSQRLSGGHWVSVARGPPEDIVDAWGTFTSTLRSRSLSAEQMKVTHQNPCPKQLHRLVDLLIAGIVLRPFSMINI